jgi:ribosomal protein L19E
MYDVERADIRALEQLEAVLREVGEELATWRARALKAEAPRGASHARGDGESRGRAAELETENRQLRTRLEAARTRMQELVARLSFLEEQSREAVGSGSVATGGNATR